MVTSTLEKLFMIISVYGSTCKNFSRSTTVCADDDCITFGAIQFTLEHTGRNYSTVAMDSQFICVWSETQMRFKTWSPTQQRICVLRQQDGGLQVPFLKGRLKLQRIRFHHYFACDASTNIFSHGKLIRKKYYILSILPSDRSSL